MPQIHAEPQHFVGLDRIQVFLLLGAVGPNWRRQTGFHSSAGEDFASRRDLTGRFPFLWANRSKLKRPDVGVFAGDIKASEAALVFGGGESVVGMADGRTAGQQGHRLRGSAVVLERAKVGVDHR